MSVVSVGDMERRKRYWCIEFYDYEFGHITWKDCKTYKEAKEQLAKYEKEQPQYKWSSDSNSGLQIYERLLRKDQVKD